MFPYRKSQLVVIWHRSAKQKKLVTILYLARIHEVDITQENFSQFFEHCNVFLFSG